jgi:peroxiredoxin
MALTESSLMPLGTKAPEFKLENSLDHKYYSFSDLSGINGTVVMFICNHCPYVIHINRSIVAVANKYQSKGIKFIAISSNSIKTHPQDSPEMMKQIGEELEYPFPYLYDESQSVAKAYGAQCTPEFFVFNQANACYYRGQFDNSRPGNEQIPSGEQLTSALDRLLNNETPPTHQIPSIGCNIKWE